MYESRNDITLAWESTRAVEMVRHEFRAGKETPLAARMPSVRRWMVGKTFRVCIGVGRLHGTKNKPVFFVLLRVFFRDIRVP